MPRLAPQAEFGLGRAHILRFDDLTQNLRKSWGAKMPLYEIETDGHIIIIWAEDRDAAKELASKSYPDEEIRRAIKRPRDSWVISKSVLGIQDDVDLCSIARDCLSKAAGDKVHAIRLYMNETGVDLEQARKVVESNMVMGW